MPKSDFIPDQDANFAVWHGEFLIGCTDNAATLGIAPADLTSLGANDTAVNDGIAVAKTASDAAKQANKDKDNAIRLAEQFARALAQRIKTNPAYTPALGEALGIIGPEITPQAETKPILKAKALPHGVVELSFKKGRTDGINLYSQREGDADFVFLARDTTSPYVDNRPLLVAGKPELRKYRAIFVLRDHETGDASDIASVTCAV